MSKVIICRGIPGSGKTRWALDWVGHDPHNRIRICPDDINRMVAGDYSKDGMPLKNRTYRMLISMAAEYGKDVVIDDINLNTGDIIELIRSCDDLSIFGEISVYTRDFRAPLEVCLRGPRCTKWTNEDICAMFVTNQDFYRAEDVVSRDIPPYTNK